jgi:hypothetical protein
MNLYTSKPYVGNWISGYYCYGSAWGEGALVGMKTDSKFPSSSVTVN